MMSTYFSKISQMVAILILTVGHLVIAGENLFTKVDIETGELWNITYCGCSAQVEYADKSNTIEDLGLVAAPYSSYGKKTANSIEMQCQSLADAFRGKLSSRGTIATVRVLKSSCGSIIGIQAR